MPAPMSLPSLPKPAPQPVSPLTSRAIAGAPCRSPRPRRALAAALVLALIWLSALVDNVAKAADGSAAVPLIVGNRTIHVFRAPFGPFSPADREQGARQRIAAAFERPGEGWTSIRPTEQGISIEIDGKSMFFVLSGDARELAGETPEELANQASRVLQKAWSEAREGRDSEVTLRAGINVLLATVLLLVIVTIIVASARWLQHRVGRWLAAHLGGKPDGPPAARPVARLARPFGIRIDTHLASLIPNLVQRLLVLLAWALCLFAMFAFLTYSLAQFPLTRPAAENLSQSITDMLLQALHGVTAAIPGLFIATLIFLATWVATRVSCEFFDQRARSPAGVGLLNAHTAPATRRIVNATLWLFAIAMAYPYLPGAQTEAFKGLSVILGLMVSIGASGLVGQVAAGMMLVYTHALLVGEYVRIQDHEGTVTELGLFVTRLRTGLGEEITLPNALVLANVTRNFSRATAGRSTMLDTTITIGYDTPWRQVHALMQEAAARVPEILATPAPYIVQTALSDFYVAYKLVAQIDASQGETRARIASTLHAALQDSFNRHGVQIMSPHYLGDPAAPKLVSEAQWHAPPARAGESR